jgi:hypothetical protein
MTVTAAQLLIRSAARFRSYEANHRDKANRLANAGTDHNATAILETLDKADANARAAKEIEQFLADYPGQDVGSSDTLNAEQVSEIVHTMRNAHDEIVGLRSKVEDLKPQAEAYRVIEQLAWLSRPTPQPQAYGVDIAWRLKELVDRLREKRTDREEVS